MDRRVNQHPIMHFTHVANLPGILAKGCLQADSLVCRDSCLTVEAADLDIKASRRRIAIPLPPYGSVADYIPFYFASRSPMLFKLARGGVPSYVEGQDPLVYLVTTVETVVDAGLPWLFSDGNCAASVTEIFDDLSVLDSVVDWEVMRARMWNNTADDPDRMRRRMAEFLVHERLPVSHLTHVVVRNSGMKANVEAILTEYQTQIRVLVRPGWYF